MRLLEKDMATAGPAHAMMTAAQAVEPKLEADGVRAHCTFVGATLFMDGDAIAGPELTGDKLPRLVRSYRQVKPGLANICVVAALHGLDFRAQQNLRRTLTRAGGMLIGRAASETFQSIVEQDRATIEEASRFSPPQSSVVLKNEPPAERSGAHYLSPEELKSFAKALAEDEDSSSVVS